MTIALLDGDLVAYRAAAASMEVNDDFDGPVGKPIVDVEKAIDTALFFARHWTQSAGCNHAFLCLSGELNFRKSIYPEYKANRKGGKPPHYHLVVDALKARYKVQEIPWLEADDLMGIIATSPKFEKNSVIVSYDKDMAQIPGARVWNPLNSWRDAKKKRPMKPEHVAPRLGNYRWMMQTLTGDTVDNYKGVPGIGAKTAAVLLGSVHANMKAWWGVVLQAYLDAGLTEADALLNARLARILRREDLNREKEEIYLWHPTKPETFSISTKPQSENSATAPGSNTPVPISQPASTKRKKASASSATNSRTSSKASSKPSTKAARSSKGTGSRKATSKKSS